MGKKTKKWMKGPKCTSGRKKKFLYSLIMVIFSDRNLTKQLSNPIKQAQGSNLAIRSSSLIIMSVNIQNLLLLSKLNETSFIVVLL
jgi:hypothetical protein